MPAFTSAAACLVLLVAPAATDPGAAAVRQRLPQLLADLDSPRFDVRQRAAGQIESWLERPELGGLLAGEFSRRLLDPRLSYEVRWRLDRWTRRLPAAEVAPAAEVSDAELGRLVGQLDHDDYAVRVGAGRRVEWLAQSPAVASRVMVHLKRYLAAPGLSEQARQRLEPLREAVRGRWLTTDPAQWNLPPTSGAQIRAWVDELAQPGDGAAEAMRRSRAERELLDALARDEDVPRVAGALRARLADPLDREGASRLEAVLEWTRPAMVAEYWQERRHKGEQHLTVGEPSQAEGAVRPSHFDRIDDGVAHCVSGNTLAPGDYPAAVAFLHPVRDDAFFHLVNLPTPRRRMAYRYLVKRDESERLGAITRRTLARWKEESRPIGEPELKLLGLLDPRQASRFAAAVLLAPPPARPAGAPDLLPRPSRTSPMAGARREGPVDPVLLAEFLAEEGTCEACVDLLKALAPPAAERHSEALRQALWAAALVIAARDPWPQVDAWLAGLLARDDALDADGTRLGATAAGVLLTRHGQSPDAFALRPTGPLHRSPVPGRRAVPSGYRYLSADSPDKVRRWWRAGPARGG